MNKEALDAAIRAEFDAEASWSQALAGRREDPLHVYRWVDRETLQAISTATGAKIRRSGEGSLGRYVLDYGGCVFSATRGEAD